MRIKYILGTACGLGLACLVNAQPVPTTPPPATQTSPAQPAGGKVTPNTAYAFPEPLYSRADVGKALNLTQDQITRLGTADEKVRELYREQYSKLGTFSDPERLARIEQLNRQFSTEWNKNAADIFNADQRTRYQQLQQQYGGFSTLMDPDVQRRLTLTPEQVKSLGDNVSWDTLQLNEVKKAAAADAAKARQQYQDYWKQRQERFDRLLTAEQMKAWREMTGDPFSFTGAIPPP
jgi:hypothetical protein